MKKPSWWLRSADFAAWKTKYADRFGVITCTHPGCSSRADTVDHIVPRSDKQWEGDMERANAPDNLQPMCRRHNSSKGIRPDNYWSRDFFFDREVNKEKLRASQLDFVYQPLFEVKEQLAGRYSQVNGKLLCFFQITGAGKTIGKAMIPFALNHGALIVGTESGHKLPRVDRCLILAKESQLRDQIAEELGGTDRKESELVEYGILPIAPRVRVANGSSDLDSYSTSEVQFVVCCAQTLWDREGSSIDDLSRVLDRFPCIIFDEMHFAHEKIRQVVQKARHSLCFGMTATPIEANGSLLGDMVRVSNYGYYQACSLDNSMKSLGDATDIEPGQVSPTFQDIVRELEPEAAILVDGTEHPNPGQQGWSLPSMLNVANGVVEKQFELDRCRTDTGVSGHRRNNNFRSILPKLRYPSHAIIRVNNIENAEYLEEWLNQKFDSDRERYPKEQGWNAAAAHSGNKRNPAKPLNADHPWFRALNNSKNGKSAIVDEKCARILIVNSLAKEGTNNRFCTIVGWGKPCESTKELVQAIGRGIRSVHVVDGDKLCVPPAVLDRLYVITHKCWNDGDTFEERQIRIIEALRFIENSDRCQLVVSLDAWLEEGDELNGTFSNDSENGLDMYETLGVVGYLAEQRRTGNRPSLKSLADRLNIKSGNRKKLLRQLMEGINAQNSDVMKKVERQLCLFQTVLTPDLKDVIAEERINVSLKGENAVQYVTAYDGGEELERQFIDNPLGLQLVCEKFAPLIRNNFFVSQELATKQSLHDIVSDLAHQIKKQLGLHSLDERIFQTLWGGVHCLLDYAPGSITIKKGGKYDIPAVVLAITPQIRKKLIGYTIRRLHEDGLIPDHSYVLGLKNLEEETIDD